jgi:SAM-dependent methyltransferase
MEQAGFKVYSYEVSHPRARFAAEKLACRVFEPDALPMPVDCLFSAHVIEHLTSPNILWEVARRVVKPGGLAVFFTPNGEPSLARTNPNYHRWWGKAHPLMLNADCLQTGAAKYGFSAVPYSSPYDFATIRSRARGPLQGNELLVIARAVGERSAPIGKNFTLINKI